MKYYILIILCFIASCHQIDNKRKRDNNKNLQWHIRSLLVNYDIYYYNKRTTSLNKVTPLLCDINFSVVKIDTIRKEKEFFFTIYYDNSMCFTKPMNVVGVLQRKDSIFSLIDGGVIYDRGINFDSISYSIMKESERKYIKEYPFSGKH